MAHDRLRKALLAAGAGLLALACSRELEGPSRQSIAHADLAVLREAIQAWAEDHGGELPAELGPLVRPQPDGKHYLPAGTPALFDPWGRAYLYLRGEGADGCRVVTLGRDGAEGGTGEDADLDQRSSAGEGR